MQKYPQLFECAFTYQKLDLTSEKVNDHLKFPAELTEQEENEVQDEKVYRWVRIRQTYAVHAVLHWKQEYPFSSLFYLYIYLNNPK